MSRVEFFLKDGTQDESKINKASITNHGPESNFGSVDVDLKKSGNTLIYQRSQKNILLKKKLHPKKIIPGWQRVAWQRVAQKLNRLYQKSRSRKSTWIQCHYLQLKRKKSKKLHQNEKLIKALEKCKLHGDPVTPSDIDLLNSLNEDQVQDEIAYLKLTSGEYIRYKRKVGSKIVYFTVDELRSQIQDVIKPVSNLNKDKSFIRVNSITTQCVQLFMDFSSVFVLIKTIAMQLKVSRS